MDLLYRHPILDGRKELFGFEFKLRENADNPAKVMNILIEENVIQEIDGKKCVIEFSEEFIESDAYELFPPSKVVIKLRDVKEVNEKLVNALKDLKAKGYELLISDFRFDKVSVLPLLPLSDYVSVNWKRRSFEGKDFEDEVDALKYINKKVIIYGVNTEEDFEEAKKLGDLFQGNLFPPSVVKNGRNLRFLKTTIIKLYDAIEKKDVNQIVNLIESDVGLTYKILKWVKNLYPGKSKDIQSVSDAVLFLSINNIANLLLVIAMSELFAGKYEEEIIKRSFFRAVLAQELAKIYIPEYAKEGYMIGLFSLVNELMNEEPASLARELGMSSEVVEALEKRYNEFGLLLSLVELLENHHDNERILRNVAKTINTTEDKMREAVKIAKERVENFTR
ncbi:EAL and HDOD domain-containing protein [Aquifex aeolicus]|uniref:HDOD domain-containing protein n=1 Tax=Aquifex aeolicus (strain VF5) TaxID=224324 RepID=O67832_AQUAE|nr:HDOD domain-containing protein [Aquifex aeolicus]AAC07799.1 hypothetical protein aq_2044 [Aquifex aeolicus VF5]